MAVWETEDESVDPSLSPGIVTLPTPADTPYRTPSRTSRRSRRSMTPPKSRSPPLPPNEKGGRSSKKNSRECNNFSNDDGISVLDPRRFTPTLHASLVSEILSLRRDSADKLKIIERLEAALEAARLETETLNQSILSTAKENRGVKRQLALLEGGTSSALAELTLEREEAVEATAEVKQRLDVALRKVRNLEDESTRVHEQWAREKDEWEEEKRKYERKVHVAESRLKLVLDEVAACQESQLNDQPEDMDAEADSVADDARSVRTMSLTNNSIRFSFPSTGSPVKANDQSLADELNFGDTDEEIDHFGRESVLSHHNHDRHYRTFSRDSIVSKTHGRTRSSEGVIRMGSISRNRFSLVQILEKLHVNIPEDVPLPQEVAPPKPTTVDAQVQCSLPHPPPELSLGTVTCLDWAPTKVVAEEGDLLSHPYGASSQVHQKLSPGRIVTQKHGVANIGMVHGSSQTVEAPLSPPKTPTSPWAEKWNEDGPAKTSSPPMIDTSTQTDETEDNVVQLARPPMPIPSISIIPPASRPGTADETKVTRLPPLSKDFGCQVALVTAVPATSIGVQTDAPSPVVEVSLEQQAPTQPVRPPTATSRSESIPVFDLSAQDPRYFSPVPHELPPRNPRRLASKQSLRNVPPAQSNTALVGADKTRDAVTGISGDDGPLANQKSPPLRRTQRDSSQFTTSLDAASSDDGENFVEHGFSDPEFHTALSAPRPRPFASSRGAPRNLTGSAHPASPEQVVPSRMSSRHSSTRPASGAESFTTYVLPEADEGAELPMIPYRSPRASDKFASSSSTRSSMLRRSGGMAQNSMMAMHNRVRTPSILGSHEPPFPIPTRASSRKPGTSAGSSSDGRSYGGYGDMRRGEPWHRRGMGRPMAREASVRKVRSAAAFSRNPRYRRHGSRSPPRSPLPPLALNSPGLPPLPQNDLTMMRRRRSGDKLGASLPQHHPPGTLKLLPSTGDIALESPSATDVVEAIAQTMVGEWMYKYVRRRKSFGVPDSTNRDDTSSDRHRRWVWLAPYDRSILWSSKQPLSGSALMGKSGRKLLIQSVLDVKDDNPPPKGVTQIFNRSILILTPQRALKFTASNADRHYVWLAALTFLIHSQQAIPDQVAFHLPASAMPEHLQAPPPPPPKLRRPGIRDSIRLAKGKAVLSGSAGPASVVSSSHTDTNTTNVPTVPAVPPLPNIHPPLPPVPVLSLPEFFNILQPLPPTSSSQPAPSIASDGRRSAAEAPSVPRFHHQPLHSRKRSNTGGHIPPPLSYRGFSGPASNGYHTATNSVAGNSVTTSNSSELFASLPGSGGCGPGTWVSNTVASARTSEASSRPNNFFDAIGTVRMEAFISPIAVTPAADNSCDYWDEPYSMTRRRSRAHRRRLSRNYQRDSFGSRGGRGHIGGMYDPVDRYHMRDDPFGEF